MFQMPVTTVTPNAGQAMRLNAWATRLGASGLIDRSVETRPPRTI